MLTPSRYVDLYSSTSPLSNAYIGNLSVVVHLSNKTRIACANFTQVSPGEGSSNTASSINLSTGVSSGYAKPTGSGVYNTTSVATATVTVRPTTGVPVSPSSTSTAFAGAAPMLISGAAGAVVAAAAALWL